MDRQVGARRRRQDHAARFADAQRSLGALAVERLFERQLVRCQPLQQFRESVAQLAQTFRHAEVAPAEVEDPTVDDARVVAATSPHHVRRPQCQRRRSVEPARLSAGQLQATETHDQRARVDAQDPYHRHVRMVAIGTRRP